MEDKAKSSFGFKKSEIAIIQLKSAINLYNQGDYISALTLAGASSEILVSMCRARGLPFTHTFPINKISELNNPDVNIEKYIKTTLNKNKNELKHHNLSDDYLIEGEFWRDTLGFISDTYENYKTLFGKMIEDNLVLDFIERNFKQTI